MSSDVVTDISTADSPGLRP